ncbi:calcium-binding protein [Pelagibacterium sp.]|uniref:calcium-binding protein n=1 Tax=Pelagibacterium sp. TaxID=1967288 RepID=UPI003A9410E3
MARMTWFDGNQGAYGYLNISNFDVQKATEGALIATYNGREGPQDDTQTPARFKMILEEATLSEDGNGDPYYSGGVIKKIIWYNSAGDITHQATGLSLDLNLAWTFLFRDNDRGFRHMLFEQVDTFIGADDSMNEPDDWDGEDITTGQRDDTVLAMGGDDYIKDLGGSDHYDGGDGFDAVSYDEVFWNPHLGNMGIDADLRAGTVIGPDGNTDTLVSIEILRGTHFDDVIRGDGGEYNSFRGLRGDDTINGRGGIDEVRYDRDVRYGGTNGVEVDLKAGTATDGFGDTDTLMNIERVRGSDYDDVLRDDAGDNRLRGNAGNDTLCASQGNDELQGGDGADVFQFKTKNFGSDVIWDFEIGTDKIEILAAKRFGQLTIEDDGNGNALVSFGENTVHLDYISADDLSRSDFLF